MWLLKKLFGSAVTKKGCELERTYINLLIVSGFSKEDAKPIVRRAIQECISRGRIEGTLNLPNNFGNLLLQHAYQGVEFAENIVAFAKSEGASDEDILKWWNMHDLDRRMMTWNDDVYRLGIYKSHRENGLAEEDALWEIKRDFVLYGTYLERDRDDYNRPMPNELRERIGLFIYHSADKFKIIKDGFKKDPQATCNFMMRMLIAEGVV